MNELNSLKENKGIEEKEENKPSTQDSERLNELLKAYSLDELAEFTKRGIAIKDIPLKHLTLPTGENFTPDVLEDFLNSRKMEVKWNEITKAIDFKGRGFIGQAQEHIGANIVHLLYSELQGCYKRCTLDTIAGYLNIVATRNILSLSIPLLLSYYPPPYATQKRRVSVGRQNAEYISGIAFLSAVPSSLLPFTVL